MKKIQIGPPLSAMNQSEPAHILSLLLLIFIALLSCFTAIASQDLQTTLFIGAFSIFMIVITILSISQRKKYKQNALYIDDLGFSFKDGRQNILWEEIEDISLTYIIKKDINNIYTGYPFVFLKLKIGYSHNDSVLKIAKMDVPYIVSEDYFKKYMGKSKDFTIAINIENATEGGSQRIIEDLPLKVSKIRPLIEVNTKEEYNKKISEFVNPEMQEEYILE